MIIPPDIRTKLDEAVSTVRGVIKYADSDTAKILRAAVKPCGAWAVDPNNTDIGFTSKHKRTVKAIVVWGGTAKWCVVGAVEYLLRLIDEVWSIVRWPMLNQDRVEFDRLLLDIQQYVESARKYAVKEAKQSASH